MAVRAVLPPGCWDAIARAHVASSEAVLLAVSTYLRAHRRTAWVGEYNKRWYVNAANGIGGVFGASAFVRTKMGPAHGGAAVRAGSSRG